MNTDRLYPSSTDDSALANTFAEKISSLILVLHLFLLLRVQLVCLPSAKWTTVSFTNCLLGWQKKYCSLDLLPACVMKEYNDILLLIFTMIINCWLSHGVMPNSLKTAMLLSLLKKKNADHEIFSNFRPISNLKLISKLIEKAVAL